MKAIKIIFVVMCISIFNISAQENNNKSEQEKIDSNKIVTSSDNADIARVKAIQANLQDSSERYKIGFQDVLQVSVLSVFGSQKIAQTVSVGRDGTILLPRIPEPIIAVCKTERELKSLVTKLYSNYYRNPYVNIRIVEQRSQPFAVIGAVKKPGQFFLNQKIRLLRLLTLAGGQDVENSGSRVQVARFGNVSACNPVDEKDSDIEFLSYSLNDVLTGKNNPWMEPGDIVSVLEAEEAYVVGEVFKPAKILLKEPITLSEAIAKAGGLSSTAKTSKVIIQRKEKDSPVRNELVFNLKDIKAKKIPDPLLQANDIVEVSTSNAKVVKRGLFRILTSGIGNIFYRIPL